MAWALGNAQSGYSFPTTGTSVSLTAPTGIANGDLLVAAVGVDISAGGDPGVASIPGFTAIGSQYEPAQFQGSIRLSLMYKIAASEAGNYTASWTTAGLSAWGIARFTGNATSSPVDRSAMGGDPAAGATNIVAPALTALTGSSDLLVCAFASCGGGNPYMMPAGMTTVFNNNQSNANAVFLGMSYLALASSANTSTETATATGGNPNATGSVAFLAAGAGAPSEDRAAARSAGAAQALILMRERASGLLEPVRELLKPRRPGLILG